MVTYTDLFAYTSVVINVITMVLLAVTVVIAIYNIKK